MNKQHSHIDKIGWQFDNTYTKLPDSMFSKLSPTPVKAPEVVIFNHALSKEMRLDLLQCAGHIQLEGLLAWQIQHIADNHLGQ